jgi:hypothetical protein
MQNLNSAPDLLNILSTFKPEADLWIFYSANKESWQKEELIQEFSQNWAHHGVAIKNVYCVYKEHFLVVVGEKPEGEIGGCGRDGLFQIIKKMDENYKGDLVPYQNSESTIVHCTRDEFRQKAASGEIHQKTIVYNMTQVNVGLLRANFFEDIALNSWHHKAYRLNPPI